ncbi:MAG TPA: hypothetical protein VN666_21700 [Nitrospira sp.]|nr:hypothetical protein [Nitrospira sp.]
METQERKPPKEPPYAYVNRFYGLAVKPGMRVTMPGHRPTEEGVVVRKQSYDHYVHVRFSGQTFDVPVYPLELKYE